MNLLVVGLVRAGKDTIADYLVSKYGFFKYNFSDVLRDRILKRGAEPTKEEMIAEGMNVRKEFGSQSVIAEILLKKVDKTKDNVFTGAREPSEEIILRRELSDLKIIKIEAPLETRFKRSEKNNIEDIINRDKHDSDVLGVKKIIAKADYSIDNSGNLEDLYRQVDEILEKIKNEKFAEQNTS